MCTYVYLNSKVIGSLTRVALIHDNHYDLAFFIERFYVHYYCNEKCNKRTII